MTTTQSLTAPVTPMEAMYLGAVVQHKLRPGRDRVDGVALALWAERRWGVDRMQAIWWEAQLIVDDLRADRTAETDGAR